MIDYNDEPLQRLEPAYLQHFGLLEPPFTAAVDERFYFSTPEAGQRMSMLVHMTQYSDMVLMVLGEEGMGKTTLLQNYIKLAHDNWHICRINANPMMDKDQLLFRIAKDFGLESLPADSAELQEMLYDKMTQLHQNDVLPVIIIDDAHELPVDAISQLFIMAEIKAGDVTMVHVVLFAEPDIDKTIDASNARKIRERIGHTFELSPFDEDNTADYILNRLTHAGLQGENPFSTKVLRQIHKQSQGNPARINELAHIALDEALGGTEPEEDEPDEYSVKPDRLLTPMRVFAALSIATIAATGLWQQDRINAFFAGQTPDTASPVSHLADNAPRPDDGKESPFARLKEKIIKLEPDETETPAPPPEAPQTDVANIGQIEDPAIAEQLQTANKPVAPPLIERIEPAGLTASRQSQTITLHGKNFSPDSEVSVSWSGHKKQLPKSRIHVDSASRIRIELVTGKQADTWQISVGAPAQGKSNIALLKVTADKPPSQTAAQWLAAQPAQNLTLQLLGSHSMSPIKKYIEQYQLQDEAVVYQTTHAGKDWYVLFYGSYRQPQQAQQVIEHLPKKARANKPWLRSFASIRAQQQKAGAKKPAPVAANKTQAQALNNIEANEAWLWTQDPSHYTLQLLGTQNIDNIRQFIKQHQLRGKVVYYHTQRDKQDWYALLYGVYPNNVDAKSAVGQLPPTIKKLSPWVRNFSAIHAEMGQAKQP